MSPNLNILMQDEHIIAIYKPSGLLVHRSNIDRRETQFALQLVRDLIGTRVYPVHRLDKPTAGVLLFAKQAQTGIALNKAFAQGDIEKSYLAIVRGIPAEQGLIDHPLKKLVDAFDDADSEKEQTAKAAQTRFQRLNSVELPFENKRYKTSRYALVQLNPLTGRRHQLRRHMKHLFHPIIGDTSYGDGTHNQLFRENFDCHRLLLVATRLSFKHPITEEPIDIQTDPDEQFTRLMGLMEWSLPTHNTQPMR